MIKFSKKQKDPVRSSLKFVVRKNQGFTLIEVMVALTIMVTLLAISLSYSQRGTRQIALFRERARVIQEISRARSLTATLFRERDEKICGYGVHFGRENPAGPINKITIYKDIPPNPDSCPIQSQPGDQEFNSGEAIDEIVLDRAVYFCTAPTDIFFLPPKPDLFFNGIKALPDESNGNTTTVEVTIELCLVEHPSQKSTITVNLLGQISSE